MVKCNDAANPTVLPMQAKRGREGQLKQREARGESETEMERYRRLEIESRLKVQTFLGAAAAAKLDKMILEDDFLYETPPPRFFSDEDG